MNKVERHMAICKELNELTARKDADYGSSTSDTYKRFGIVSYLTRLYDKLNRASSLIKTGEQKVADEKLEDTLLDMANYCILAVDDLRQNEKIIVNEEPVINSCEVQECANCKYKDTDEHNYPCKDCRSSKIFGTKEYSTAPYLFSRVEYCDDCDYHASCGDVNRVNE